MIYFKWYYRYYYVILMCIICVLCLNVYLVLYFSKDNKNVEIPVINYNATYFATQNILSSLSTLDDDFDKPFLINQSKILKELNVIISSIQMKMDGQIDLFAQTIKIMSKNGLMPISSSPYLGSTIKLLKTSKITKIINAIKGTQLKFMITLENKQQVLFKPKWYLNSDVIEGPVYAGKDRYNGEIIAFYISLIIGLPRVPIVVKRILDSTEIKESASVGLKKTMYLNSTTKETCFFGKCFYCKKEDPVCTKSGRLEGAAIFYLPSHLNLQAYLHPWRRTYNTNKFARWENENNYCKDVLAKYGLERVLDFVEVSIFDFIIGNGDRHRYELIEKLNNTLLLIDNGKSFGNPYEDHLDILAPLYQCCIIRLKMWNRLKSIKGGNFTIFLQKMLDIHESVSLLTLPHYRALERRLRTVYATVSMCKKSANDTIFK
ncbi:glycosaminoglycan xylosylkinase [Daktulosphaira vitifoliae]|uniref:glycosaminoglycan xylosylkinase n=1 Tax=Daktulosphaira vitifoliae TaxID=58002 RepID=UPI0021A9BD31|nr:glycosaminoglycan xylosylkinase [Daktulosphaira vitifoliae]